jgi:hypothetical protein
MSQPQPEGPPTLPSLNTVDRVLKFVDRPWKIAAVLVLTFGAVIGWTLWEKRAEIAEQVLSRYVKPRLEADRFTPKFAAELLGATRADVVILVRAHWHENFMQDIEGYRRDDPAWKPSGNPRPIFYAERDPQLLIGLIEGKPICRDVNPSDGEEERALAALGMKRRCYVAVPPLLSALLGGLMVAWRVPLAPEAEGGAQRLLYQAAAKLATW